MSATAHSGLGSERVHQRVGEQDQLFSTSGVQALLLTCTTAMVPFTTRPSSLEAKPTGPPYLVHLAFKTPSFLEVPAQEFGFLGPLVLVGVRAAFCCCKKCPRQSILKERSELTSALRKLTKGTATYGQPELLSEC